MYTILKLILGLFFGSTDTTDIIIQVLFILGSWMLLKKSDQKPWWALVPCAREYQLAPVASLVSVFLFTARLIWGFSKKYQPLWKIEDMEAFLEKLVTEGSAQITDQGLSVNIKERSVREFFSKKMLLRDIHMAIPKGHMVLLLGGSGAGKTTFLNAVTGFEKADAHILLNGEDVYKSFLSISDSGH